MYMKNNYLAELYSGIICIVSFGLGVVFENYQIFIFNKTPPSSSVSKPEISTNWSKWSWPNQPFSEWNGALQYRTNLDTGEIIVRNLAN